MPKAAAKAESTAITRKNGRPTKFEARFVQQARKMALLGLTQAEIASVLGVAESTFKVWMKEHPAMELAVKEGRVLADANVAAALYERAIGYSHKETVLHQFGGRIIKTTVTKHYAPDTQAATKWLHNRQSKLWKSQVDPDQGEDMPTPVKVVFEVVDARKRSPDASAQPAAG